MTWFDAPLERRPLVVVEDHLYHTGELAAAIAAAAPALLRETTMIAIDREGPDTEATIEEWRRRYPALRIVAAIRPNETDGAAAGQIVPLTAADTADATACARLMARHLRPGGILVQDIQLETLAFIPHDRWWESIFLAATVRGMFPDRPPLVRFLSNKRGYSATFGRELMNAGFDPRDVMDKSALGAVVVPALAQLFTSRFPFVLRLARSAGGHAAAAALDLPCSNDSAERQEVDDSCDLILWPGGAATSWELSGRLIAAPPGDRVILKTGGHEAATWLALLTDRIEQGHGIPVVDIGKRVGPGDVDKAEATNLAARHIHALRGRLRDAAAIVTANHAYRLRDGLTVGICRPAR